ncbi:MAG: protein-export chaperone SecB [Alphaproteobacteria bacterium]|nr:protein-export chaperone SecB [Alphaproteobacteria bacterium]
MSEPDERPPSFMVKGQYIKDLSFENPNAPHSLAVLETRPSIDVRVDLRAQKLQEEFYEVQLAVNSRATLEGATLFLVELVYAGVFEVVNVPADRLEALLWVECPFVLFPFARRVVADVTRDGGFPPLMLDPIDFHALYMQQRAKKSQEAEQQQA